MKILFVTLCSIDLNTSAMMRNNALIKGFIENGHQIDILTIPSSKSNPFYDESNIFHDNNIKVFKYLNDTPYTRLIKEEKSVISSIKKMIFPIMRYAYHKTNIFDNTIYIAKKIEVDILEKNKYDYVVSSSDPKSSHVAVETLIDKGLNYNSWIQYWGDPFSIDITNKSFIPNFQIKKIEQRILAKADKVVYVSPLTLQKQKHIFPEQKQKMVFHPIPYFKKRFFEEVRSDKLKLGYFGDYHSNIRNIIPLYRIIANSNSDFHLTLAGNSNLNLKTTSNIVIHPRITRERIEILEESSDVLVCILNIKGTQIPGKIYHYAATNKPILILIDGEEKEQIREFLEKFDRFLICNNDEKSINEVLMKLRVSLPKCSPSPYLEPARVAKYFLEPHS